MARFSTNNCILAVTAAALLLTGCSSPGGAPLRAEVRGTWLTTTGNDAIATPEKTAASMRALRAVGLNTVYVEVWKNGYTQFPSEVLRKTIGVDRHPALTPRGPSDSVAATPKTDRDLLQETLI